MPIHLDILSPRQAEAGKIKIGGLGKAKESRSGTDYRQPIKRDYFLITLTTRDGTGNFEPDTALMEKLAKDPDGKIREIPVLIESDDLDEVFPSSLACYQGRTLFCRGNGKDLATRQVLDRKKRNGRDVTVKTGKTERVACPCSYLGADKNKGLQCLPHGTFWCTIVAGEETRIGARHAFRTTSWNSIRAIRGALETTQKIVGTVVGVPLWLCVKSKLTQTRGSAGTKTIYIVHLECRTKDLFSLQKAAIEQAKTRHAVAELAGSPLKLGMAAPGDDSESEQDQAEIQEEYHPEFLGDDASEPDDTIAYDPETGEVYDTDVVDPPIDPPSPEPQSQEVPEDPADEILPEGHRIRERLKKMLTEVAMARDFSGDDLKTGRQEIWAEACTAANFPGLPWKSVTTVHAIRVDEKLQDMLKEHEAS